MLCVLSQSFLNKPSHVLSLYFLSHLFVVCLFLLQVENLNAVHPDYGNRVQALLDKYNAEAKKVLSD